MLIVDASALAGWLMPDEVGVDLAALAIVHEVFAAPWLSWAEIRNTLVVCERRGRLPAAKVDEAVILLDSLRIVLDSAPSSAAVFMLCRKHALTAYDALYLELAMRQGAVLASRDSALVKAARAEGVVVV